MGMRLADRGPRAAAGGGHKKECPAPCSGPTAAALPLLHSLDLRLGLFPGRRSRLWAWAWAQRGGGSPRRGGSGDGAGAGAVGPRAGVMAGHQGQAALEDQGRKRSACDWCPEVRIRAPGEATPMMVTVLPQDGQHFGRSFILLLDPSAPSPGARLSGLPSRTDMTSPTFRAGMISDRGKGWGLRLRWGISPT